MSNNSNTTSLVTARQDGLRTLPSESSVKAASIVSSVPPMTAVSTEASVRYSLTLAPSFDGVLRMDDHQIEGWIARKDGQQLTQTVSAIMDGDRRVRRVRKTRGRSSAMLPPSPAHACHFELDLTSFLANRNASAYFTISIYVGEVKSEEETLSAGMLAMRSTFSRDENVPVNGNAYLMPDSSISIADWQIRCDHEVGLRVDGFSFSPSDGALIALDPQDGTSQRARVSPGSDGEPTRTVPERYTRVAFTEVHDSGAPVVLSTVLNVNADLEERELRLATLVRADRLTSITGRLTRNGQVVAVVEMSADTGWTEFSRELTGSLVSPRHRTARYLLELEIRHCGRGYIDIAGCTVSTNPSLRLVYAPDYLNRVSRELKEARNPSYLRNGDFQDWPNGFVFNRLQSKQETAQGWRVECRNSEAANVQVALYQISANLSEDGAEPEPGFGMRVRTGEFSGIMRLVSVLDRHFKDCRSLRFSVGVHVLGQQAAVKVLKRIYVFGRRHGGEEVLHVIARRPVLQESGELAFQISESDLIRLRRAASGYSSLLIGLDLEQNMDIVLSKAGVYNDSDGIDNVRSTGTLLTENRFEDEGIEAQVEKLKGLEDWSGDQPLTPESVEMNQPDKSGVAMFSAYRRPTIRRPSREYPSIDIVVPIFNAKDAVMQCLRSVVEETTVPYTLLCVDDASDTDTAEWLDEFASHWQQVEIIRNAENLGYTRSVNRGFRESNADWVCVLNSDCIVTRHWLERLVETSVEDDRIGIVSPLSNAASYQSVPRIYQGDEPKNGWSFNPMPAGVTPNDMADLVWKYSLSARPQVGVANGFCQLIRKDMLNDIGLLDEISFPRGFGEENDLCARATDAGWQIRVADDTYVYHLKSRSFGHEQRKSLSKEGRQALHRKHPDVDWNEIVDDFENIPELVELRQRIVKAGF